ncbi:MAG: CDP-alcohol phosphatidyltransferase family protein [Oscillospiraceae bacterium]|nr:CDP-alcohol phosphatidyltransferase family protein [Oscillospiraceae bacterium]
MSIPNMLSIFRLVLIPVFLLVYFLLPDCGWLAGIILVVSGLTDVADGIIARKFNMVTQLGKILDPAADKITQAAVCVALSLRYQPLILLTVIFFLKEILMLIGGLILVKSGKKIRSSKWFGKVATVVLYTVLFLFIVTPNLSDITVYILCGISIGFVVFAFLMYIPEFVKIKKED